jgi:hypothetical protein
MRWGIQSRSPQPYAILLAPGNREQKNQCGSIKSSAQADHLKYEFCGGLMVICFSPRIHRIIPIKIYILFPAERAEPQIVVLIKEPVGDR